MDFISIGNSIKKYRFYLGFLIVVGLSLGGWSVFSSRNDFIPQSFMDARRESATISEQIVGLSGVSSGGIKQIQKLQEDKKYNEALDAVVAERKRVIEMRDKGSELLKNLSVMTESIPEIRPEGSRTAALDAINYETGIVNHLLTYNESLDQLFRLVTARVLYDEDITSSLNDIVTKINGEIATINDLNKKFSEAMNAL